MKYIRTKNNRIYEVVEEYNTTYLVKAHKNYREIKKAIDGTKIVYKASCINQADTIDELCDNGIIIDLNGKHTITYYLQEKKCWLMGDRKYISVFYGAIWTDKGLIYVAKMNDKGELELL